MLQLAATSRIVKVISIASYSPLHGSINTQLLFICLADGLRVSGKTKSFFPILVVDNEI